MLRTRYLIEHNKLEKIRRLIIKDIKTNNACDSYIENMTLNDYFRAVKEAILGSCDPTTGLLLDPFESSLNTLKWKTNIAEADAKIVTELVADGRGLFTEHFNSQLEAGKSHFGSWENIDMHEQNQWYHPERVDDSLWFKECVQCIGHAGHPVEMLFGNFYPREVEENKWILEFSTIHAIDYFLLNGYLRMKTAGWPVFIWGGDHYLKTSQKKNLYKEGFLQNPDYNTGYGRNG